jgi:hypothetical protein
MYQIYTAIRRVALFWTWQSFEYRRVMQVGLGIHKAAIHLCSNCLAHKKLLEFPPDARESLAQRVGSEESWLFSHECRLKRLSGSCGSNLFENRSRVVKDCHTPMVVLTDGHEKILAKMRIPMVNPPASSYAGPSVQDDSRSCPFFSLTFFGSSLA